MPHSQVESTLRVRQELCRGRDVAAMVLTFWTWIIYGVLSVLKSPLESPINANKTASFLKFFRKPFRKTLCISTHMEFLKSTWALVGLY